MLKMSICKDCLHYEVCQALEDNGDLPKIKPIRCGCFKDRSKFIELPCKVGDLVYYITPDKTIRSMLVAQIFIDRAEKTIGDGGGIYFLFENFDKTVFLTKEEAEQALMEMSSK